MKEQIENLIKSLEAEKTKAVYSDSYAGQCAQMGRESGLDSAIHHAKLLLLTL